MSRNDWLFAIFGWDPEYERKVPRRRKIQFTFYSFLIGISFGAVCWLALRSLDGWEQYAVYAALLTGVFALSGYNWILRRELIDRIDLESDQRAARQIQARLVPSVLPQVPGFELAHHYSPFKLVGGDYCDALRLDERHLMIAMADVSGKGTGAALLTANLQALLRFSDLESGRLSEVVAGINRHLREHTESERFVTLVLAVLDLETRQLTYVNAGHNPPLGIAGSGQTLRLEATGVPLGAFADAEYATAEVTLSPGSTLAFYTDGLSERSNREGAMYEEERILAKIRDAAGRGAAALVAELMADAERFSAGKTREDDTAVLVIRAR